MTINRMMPLRWKRIVAHLGVGSEPRVVDPTHTQCAWQWRPKPIWGPKLKFFGGPPHQLGALNTTDLSILDHSGKLNDIKVKVHIGVT